MIRFLSLLLGLALAAALQLGGTGGCGATGVDGGTSPTTGSSAVSAGGATATSRAVTSALTSALAGVGGGAGLTVKLTEEGDSEDLACTCDDVTGDCTCEDDAAESEGDVGCNFDDLPGEDDFEVCDDGLSISGDFAFSGTVTFDNAVFDECGQEITLDGTVSFSGSITLDCDGNITGTIRIFTEEACSGITGVDGDGTTHDIGMDVTMDETGDATGSVCVDGDEIDATEVETACDEASSGGSSDEAHVNIEGHVYIEDTTTPIQGAVVSTELDSETATTDSTGYFFLQTITPADYSTTPYTITISATDYQTFSESWNWGDHPTDQVFYLTPENSSGDTSVDVTGTWSGTVAITVQREDGSLESRAVAVTYVLTQSDSTVTGAGVSGDEWVYNPIFSAVLTGDSLAITEYPSYDSSDDCDLYSNTVTYTVSGTAMTVTEASGVMCDGDGLGGHSSLSQIIGVSGTLDKIASISIDTFVVNLSVTGTGGAQICVSHDGFEGTCGPDGGFTAGQTGTISVMAELGSSYSVTIPSNQPAADYCIVTSGESGVFGSSMATAVIECSN